MATNSHQGVTTFCCIDLTAQQVALVFIIVINIFIYDFVLFLLIVTQENLDIYTEAKRQNPNCLSTVTYFHHGSWHLYRCPR